MDEPLRCYRHPDRETYVSCSECGRPICPDCMTHGPVGIRCPDHATASGAVAAPRRAARTASRTLSPSGAYVTFTLIGINVGVFLVQLFMGAELMRLDSGWIYENGVLVDEAVNSSNEIVGVAHGEWWRLLTATFLHGSLVHLGMNMLVLWIFGQPLERYFGHSRFLLVYLVSGLAGSAGALVVSGGAPTVGASGAIWGILGAAVVLEARKIWVFGGQAMGWLVFFVLSTLYITFIGGNVSVGGHFGGLVGGALCALAFASFRRSPALATLSMAAVGLAAIGVSALQVA